MFDFLESEISDPVVRDSFVRLREYLDSRLILNSDVKMIEHTVKNPSSEYVIFHGLGIAPKDILITYVSEGTANPIYSKTDKQKITLNVSNPCRLRILIGSFSI